MFILQTYNELLVVKICHFHDLLVFFFLIYPKVSLTLLFKIHPNNYFKNVDLYDSY